MDSTFFFVDLDNTIDDDDDDLLSKLNIYYLLLP